MRTLIPSLFTVLFALGVVVAQSRPAGQAGEQGRRQSSPEKAPGAGRTEDRPPVGGDGLVRRGEYLVTSVAMCIECHTPRDEQGQLIRLRLLQGAQIPVRSPYAGQQWAFRAPALAGLPGGWSEQDLIRLLMTGKDSQGRTPNPPMPAFRLTREDASAVAAYLKSLGAGAERHRPDRP